MENTKSQLDQLYSIATTTMMNGLESMNVMMHDTIYEYICFLLETNIVFWPQAAGDPPKEVEFAWCSF